MKPDFYGFREHTATRLEQIAGLGETPPIPAVSVKRSYSRIALAKTTGGAIPASSSTAPGSGVVTFVKINDSGLYEVLTGETTTAYNVIQSGSVGANKIIVIGREIHSAKWIVIVEDCV